MTDGRGGAAAGSTHRENIDLLVPDKVRKSAGRIPTLRADFFLSNPVLYTTKNCAGWVMTAQVKYK